MASANSVSGSVLVQVVLRAWLISGGIEGMLRHAQETADFYAHRRQQLEALCHQYLDGLASWVSPVSGMFLWIDLSPAGIDDSYDLIRNEALAKGVLCVPGLAYVALRIHAHK